MRWAWREGASWKGAGRDVSLKGADLLRYYGSASLSRSISHTFLWQLPMTLNYVTKREVESVFCLPQKFSGSHKEVCFGGKICLWNNPER